MTCSLTRSAGESYQKWCRRRGSNSLALGALVLRTTAIPSRRHLHNWRRMMYRNITPSLTYYGVQIRSTTLVSILLKLGGDGEERSPNTFRYVCFRIRGACQPCPTSPWRKAEVLISTPFGAIRFPTDAQPCRVNFPNLSEKRMRISDINGGENRTRTDDTFRYYVLAGRCLTTRPFLRKTGEDGGIRNPKPEGLSF